VILGEPTLPASVQRGHVKRFKEEALAADEDMQLTIDAWVRKRKLAQLLELWVKGLVLDWRRLYHDPRPRRVSLPTYPFARQRYWATDVIGSAPATIEVVPKSASTAAAVTPPRVALAPVGGAKPVAVVLPKPRSITLQPLALQPSSTPLIAAARATPEPTVVSPEVPAPIRPVAVQGSLVPAAATALSRATIQEELAAGLAENLFIDRAQIDVEKPFNEMGLDSVIGVEWVRSINRRYGLNITATKVYDYPSIVALAGFVEAEIKKLSGALPGRCQRRLLLRCG